MKPAKITTQRHLTADDRKKITYCINRNMRGTFEINRKIIHIEQGQGWIAPRQPARMGNGNMELRRSLFTYEMPTPEAESPRLL